MRTAIATLMILAFPRVADAHFVLEAPAADQVQDSSGLPEKSAPCGQADPGDPAVPTDAVTTVAEGGDLTVTINEVITHPGHYRVALAADPASLPAEPAVTPGTFACGTAAIDPTVPGVLADDLFDHTSAFSAPQSATVTMPSTACSGCTLQVIEFMSDHGLNSPGGCFYHHCAKVDVVPASSLPDAGSGSASSGGCDAGGGGGGGFGLLIGMVLACGWVRRAS
jgi:hypothetical protein